MTSPNSESSPTSAGGSPQNTSTSNSNDSAIDFNKELSQRLMMKNKMPPQQQQQQQSPQGSNTSSEINARNRGPPPQPPSKTVTDNNIGPAPIKSNLLNKQSNRYGHLVICCLSTTTKKQPHFSLSPHSYVFIFCFGFISSNVFEL